MNERMNAQQHAALPRICTDLIAPPRIPVHQQIHVDVDDLVVQPLPFGQLHHVEVADVNVLVGHNHVVCVGCNTSCALGSKGEEGVQNACTWQRSPAAAVARQARRRTSGGHLLVFGVIVRRQRRHLLYRLSAGGRSLLGSHLQSTHGVGVCHRAVLTTCIHTEFKRGLTSTEASDCSRFILICCMLR